MENLIFEALVSYYWKLDRDITYENGNMGDSTSMRDKQKMIKAYLESWGYASQYITTDVHGKWFNK